MSSINLSYWVIQTIAMLLTCLIIPGLRAGSPIGAFLTVLTLALINAHVWDAALFFHVPDTLSMRTLMLLLANGAVFWIVVKFLPGIEVSGFLPAIAAPVVFTVTSLVISQFAQEIDWGKVSDEAVRFTQDTKQYFEEIQTSSATSSAGHGRTGE